MVTQLRPSARGRARFPSCRAIPGSNPAVLAAAVRGIAGCADPRPGDRLPEKWREDGMFCSVRSIVGLAAALLSVMAAGSAAAQAIARQVTLVVPYSAGGGTDTVARLIGNQMSRTLGQPVVIENVVGAGGTRANERVARSEPNGTTVLINHVALLAAPSLFTNLRYDTEKDFEPVGLVNNAPMLLVGRKSIPGDKPADYVAWIKSE